MDVNEYWFEVFSQGYNSFIILNLDRYIMVWYVVLFIIFQVKYRVKGVVMFLRSNFEIDFNKEKYQFFYFFMKLFNFD